MNSIKLRSKQRAVSAAIAFSFATSIVAPSGARAEPTPAERALAEALYRDAFKLMVDGTFEPACPKLEESDRLEPATGTKLLLGKCYAKTGRPASAWGLFVEASDADRTKGHNKEREAEARALAAGLRSELPVVTLIVASELSSLPGFELRLNGRVIGAPLWGTPMPVDFGGHVVEATATGRRAWRTSVRVQAMREAIPVVLPTKLEEAPAPAPAATEPALTLGASKQPEAGLGIVRLHVEPMNKDLKLFRGRGEFICPAPCDIWIDGSHDEEFFFRGDDIPGSARFQLRDRVGDHRVVVSPGSTSRRIDGILLMSLGGAFGLAGGLIAVFEDDSVSGQVVGGVMLGLGVGAIVTGLILVVTSRTTYEFLTPPAPPRPAPPRAR
jgi:hypothetical protein